MTNKLAALRRILRAHTGVWLALAALGFGGLAYFGMHDFIKTELAAEKQRLRPRHETVSVVVARRDLKPGEAVSADTMAVRAIPRDLAPTTAIKEATFAQYEGRRLAVPMRGGEPLVSLGLDHPDDTQFSMQVRKGVRAMTVAVDEINSISGMLRPGDRIDLMLTYQRPRGGDRTEPRAGPAEVTVALMQDVLIMATGKQLRSVPSQPGGPASARAFTTVTIEAEPLQAQRLIVAQRSGRLTAVLRHPEDRERITKRSMDARALEGPARGAATAELIVGGRGGLERQQQALSPVLNPAAKPSAPVPVIVPTAVSDAHAAQADEPAAPLLAPQTAPADAGAPK